jgi:hypothetical protein
VTAATRLTLRDLNRATLARQHLLERTHAPVLDVIEQVAGFQAQDVKAPYVGMWTRIAEFDFDEPGRLLESRAAVRILSMRGTVHLLSARDALGLRPLMQPVFDREFKGVRLGHLMAAGASVDEITTRSAELLAGGAYTAPELAAAIAVDHPEWPPELLEHVAAVPRIRVPTVQIPPRGVWGRSGKPTYRLVEDWLGASMEPYPLDEVVRRYLAAFGPATVRDVQAWCGLTRLRAVVDGMRDELIEFEGPSGEELFDLPDAPRPGGDTPAPIRILPEFDSLLVAFADRSRVITEQRRKAMATLNGMVPGTVLVDGVVAALCKTQIGKPGGAKGGGVARVMPLERLSRAVRAEIEREAHALLTAMGERYAGGDVVFEEPGDRWRVR